MTHCRICFKAHYKWLLWTDNQFQLLKPKSTSSLAFMPFSARCINPVPNFYWKLQLVLLYFCAQPRASSCKKTEAKLASSHHSLNLRKIWKFHHIGITVQVHFAKPIPRAGPSRCGAPLSSDFMTSSCSVNRVMIVVERRYTVTH